MVYRRKADLVNGQSTSPNNQPVTDEFKKRYYALENRLKSENPEMAAHRANIVGDYFKYGWV